MKARFTWLVPLLLILGLPIGYALSQNNFLVGLGSQIVGAALQQPQFAQSGDLNVTYRGLSGTAIIAPVSSLLTTGTPVTTSGVTVNGTQPVLSGACATSTQVGGTTAGSFVTTAGCSTNSVIVTMVPSATATLTLSGTSNLNDVVSITVANPNVAGTPLTITTAALGAAGTAIAAATALVTAINANATLSAANITAASGGTAVVTISQVGVIGNQTTVSDYFSTGGRVAGVFAPTTGLLSGGAGVAAPHGWVCNARDQTTTTDSLVQSAQSVAGCTLTGTTAASDVIVFTATAY